MNAKPKQINDATTIVSVLEQVLLKQKNLPLIESYVNRYRVFNMFCNQGVFSTTSQNRNKKKGAIFVKYGMGAGDLLKFETNDKFNRRIVKEKWFNLTELGYSQKVAELIEIGFLKKLPNGDAAVNIENVKRVHDVIKEFRDILP
jgi:hypothetical protein